MITNNKVEVTTYQTTYISDIGSTPAKRETIFSCDIDFGNMHLENEKLYLLMRMSVYLNFKDSMNKENVSYKFESNSNTFMFNYQFVPSSRIRYAVVNTHEICVLPYAGSGAVLIVIELENLSNISTSVKSNQPKMLFSGTKHMRKLVKMYKRSL